MGVGQQGPAPTIANDQVARLDTSLHGCGLLFVAGALIHLIAAEAFRAELCFRDTRAPQCSGDALDHGGRPRDQVGERSQLATKVVMEWLGADAPRRNGCNSRERFWRGSDR